MSLHLRSLGLLASLSLAVIARGEPSLAATSPFAPPDGAASGSTENQVFELRGILMDGGGYRFSVYDPAKKSGEWVRLNEPGHSFTVRNHDIAHDTVTLDYQGRTLTLALHTSRVSGTALNDPSLNSNQGGPRVTGAGGTGPVPKPPSPEESARFNRAVEEINRRRALRERGPMPLPGSGTTGTGPIPLLPASAQPVPPVQRPPK